MHQHVYIHARSNFAPPKNLAYLSRMKLLAYVIVAPLSLVNQFIYYFQKINSC
jgi:hypothetical protein